MRLIGLCGRSACGKSTFSQTAKEQGFIILDCDAIYKDLVSHRSPCLDEIEMHFGREVVENDSLNRRALAPIVFSDKEKLLLLNSITHKYVIAETEKIISECNEDAIILLDAPQLFESGLQERCECIVAVVASDDVCVSRIMARDNISEQDARHRLANQKSTEFFAENCDIIIYNDSTLAEFVSASEEIISSLKEGKL